MSDETEDTATETVPAPKARSARSYQVRQFIDEAQLKKDMTFSLADLSNAMVEQAALFAHYGGLAGKASRQVDDLKMVLEVTEAKVYRIMRDEFAKAGTKTTEAQLDKSVSVHPQVIAVKRALNEAKQIEAMAKTAAEGMRHRRDMLIQQGLISREEMKGELSVSRKHEVEQSQADQRERIANRLAKTLDS
jgi:hypothetical protein